MKYHYIFLLCTMFGLLSCKNAAQPHENANTQSSSNSKTYSSEKPTFSFEYPQNASLDKAGEHPKITFVLEKDKTNLGEKFMEIMVKQGNATCPDKGEMPEDSKPTHVSIKGVNYQKWAFSDAGAGNIYEIEEYVTQKEGFCICFRFVFHSSNPDNYDSPPPVFDRKAESTMIIPILESMKM